MVDRELDAEELVGLLRWAGRSDIPNPRVITPRHISWSSLFHPRFFMSVRGVDPAAALAFTDPTVSDDCQSLSRLWLQSVLFLAGVTLSAAIVQRRSSEGTIASKLDRLWDAGTLAGTDVAPELRALDLHGRVHALASRKSDEVNRLLAIRRAFLDALASVAPTTGTLAVMRKSAARSYADGRFGFVDDLRASLGRGVRAIVVYGSSVSGNRFADIDALVIVDDPEAALQHLAGTSPTWRGKELNLGIYSPHELVTMQRLSGDNLPDYGVCVWGEAEVVRKPVSDLLVRNLSFGVVRLCQQLGMLSPTATRTESLDPSRRNLYEYFVKIPANVAKGTLGAVGRQPSKQQVHEWLSSMIGFDTPATQVQAARGRVVEALASSALATGHALAALNETLDIVRVRDHRDGGKGNFSE